MFFPASWYVVVFNEASNNLTILYNKIVAFVIMYKIPVGFATRWEWLCIASYYRQFSAKIKMKN